MLTFCVGVVLTVVMAIACSMAEPAANANPPGLPVHVRYIGADGLERIGIDFESMDEGQTTKDKVQRTKDESSQLNGSGKRCFILPP